MDITPPADLGNTGESGMQFCARGLEDITDESEFWKKLEERTDPAFAEVLTNPERKWRRIGRKLDVFETVNVPITINGEKLVTTAFLSKRSDPAGVWQLTLHSLEDAPQIWDTQSDSKHHKAFQQLFERLRCYSRYPMCAVD